jgi:hypothetical protein
MEIIVGNLKTLSKNKYECAHESKKINLILNQLSLRFHF